MRLLILLAAFGLCSIAAADPLGSAFTYQGELRAGGVPANGAYDFEFALYNSENAPAPITTAVQLEEVAVSDGIFSVALDFGIAPFSGEQLWLGVAVRDGASNDPHTVLLPRQKITAAPYALHAEYVALGAVGAAEINPAQVQQRVSGACAPGSHMRGVQQNGNVDCESDAVGLTSVTSANVVDGSLVAADVNTSSIQRRISGRCGLGMYMYGVLEDGTAECDFAKNVAFDFTATGTFLDMVVRASGFPLIAMSPLNSGQLILIDCENAACSIATTRQPLTIGGNGLGVDLNTAGNPVIGSRSLTAQRFMTVTCSDPRCTAVTTTTSNADITLSDYVFGPTMNVRRANGDRPIFFYRQVGGSWSLFAFDCADAACSSGSERLLITPPGGQTSNHVNAIIRPSSLPFVIATIGQDLKAFDCSLPDCSAGTVRAIDTNVGFFRSTVAVLPNGNPVIAYAKNNSVHAFVCADAGCSSGLSTPIHTAASAIAATTVAVTPAGKPLVVFLVSSENQLKSVACTSADCSSFDAAITLRAASSLNPGESMMVINGLGTPTAAVLESDNTLATHACATATCAP